MRIRAALLTVVLSLLPFAAEAQDAKATLEAASKALGDAKSIEIQGSGVVFQVGQSPNSGLRPPNRRIPRIQLRVDMPCSPLLAENIDIG